MIEDDPRIDPADLRDARFPGSFRRYDAKAVEDFLESVAQRVTATNTLVDQLRAELEVARSIRRVEPPTDSSPFDAPDLSTLSEDDLLRLVGEETAHVLAVARKAAADIRGKAEEAAAKVIRDATAEASRISEEAEAAAKALREEAAAARDVAVTAAEAEATELRERVAGEVDEILAAARAEAESETEAARTRRAEADAEAERVLEAARDEGRSMVAEAKEVRTRVLEDLQRRRDLGRAQVERLAAARDQILQSYAAVRANVDEITAHLEEGLFEDFGGDPVLEEGFVGVVTTAADPDPDPDTGAGVDEPSAAIEPDPHAAEASSAEEPAGGSDVTPADVEATTGDHEPEQEPTEEEVATGVDRDASDAEAELDAADDAPTEAEPSGVPGDVADDVDASGSGGGDVDAIFARIRSGRAESVARAQKVLAGDDDEGDGDGDVPIQLDPATADPEAGDAQVTAVNGADEPPAAGDGEVDPALLADTDALARRQEVVEALDKKLARALKRRLADEQNLVLDTLRRSESTDPSELLPSTDDHISGYAAVAAVHLTAAAEAGAATVDEGDAASIDVSGLAGDLGAALIVPFRRRIERSAAEVEGDADELDERLRALYREWKVEHIGAATTDALLSAFASGQHAAARDGAPLRWRIDPAQGPCPDAQDNALAGAVPKGEPFPTGDHCPQAHPGCRCLLVTGG